MRSIAKDEAAAMTTPASHSPTQMPLFIASSGAQQQPLLLHAPVSPHTNHQHAWTPAPTNNDSNMSLANDLLFITGTTPADFKSKRNMTRIRKKAMGSYLTREKKPGEGRADQKQQPRKSSVYSWTSSGSEVQEPTPADQSSAEGMEYDNSHTTLGNPTGQGVTAAKTPPPPPPSPSPPITTTAMPKSPTMTTTTAATTTVVQRKKETNQTAHMPAEFILPSAPIVIPMRNTPYLIYNSYCPPPFQSIGKPLDPFATIYQAAVPRVSVESLKHHCGRSFGTRAMGIHWIPTIVDSPHSFLSTLCIASAHMDAINGRAIESVQTLALRQEVMHLIGQSLVNPRYRTNDHNIIALTQLIASELVAGQEIALSFHEAGIEVMVNQRGGLDQLGMKGRLAPVVTWVLLECALLQEKMPTEAYAKYGAAHSSRIHPSTATIPESPLYCPRGEYETLKRSSTGVTPRTLDLLKDVRMMIDLFLHETKQNRQNSLSLKNIYKKITEQYPSAAELQRLNPLTVDDWRYEAVRITSIITATAIIRRIPLSDALQHAAEMENIAPTATANITPSIEVPLSPLSTLQNSPTATANSTSPPYTAARFSPPASITSPTSSTPPTTAFLQYLQHTLESANLSQCWSEVGGVLLWVALTVGAASRKSDTILKKWYRALAVRVSIVLCFEHPEAMLATLMRMSEVIESVGADGPTEERGDIEGRGKPDGVKRSYKRRRA